MFVGQALQGLFAPWTLDAVTTGLFLLFAAMLVRSAPAPGEDPSTTGHLTDGGVADAAEDGIADGDLTVDFLGREVELQERFGGFVPIFTMMAAGEFGDKTQLITVGLAMQYGARPAIWVGEMGAIVPVSLANAYVFHTFAHRFDHRKAHLAGAALFLFFGLDTLLALLTGFSVWESTVETIARILVGTPIALG